MTVKVCVLVVTFNRCGYLKKLVKALLSQSVRPHDIVIYDNHGSDATQTMLADLGVTNHPLVDGESSRLTTNSGIAVHCVRATENSGGSGGFHNGMKIADSLGDDFIWMMDDDVLPEHDCLAELLSYMTKQRRICIPNRTTGKDFIDYAVVNINMSNPFFYGLGLRKKRIPANRLTNEVTDIKAMPFEGPLIATSLVKEIGLPNKDLFIIFDDTDYCMRAVRRTTVGFVRSAHLHKQIIPHAKRSRLMGWKDYYGLRNQYWFDRTYGTNAIARIVRPFLSRCDQTLRAIARGKWSNIHVISRAYRDGTHDRLGKTVEPGGKV